MLKRVIKSLERCLYRTAAAAELLALRLIFQRRKLEYPPRVIVLQNTAPEDFVLSLDFSRRLKKQCALPLVLTGDHSLRELAVSSGIFDDFIALDMLHSCSYRHIFCRWKTLYCLHKLSAQKVIQCFDPEAVSFEDCAMLAINAPEKYVLVDNFRNVQRSGTFYEALRTKFFTHTLPYRSELARSENEKNYADFITG